MTTPTDPLYGSQWHFDLIGDIEQVWDDYTGSGISVLVMDDGVDFSHEDLDGNYDGTYNFTYGGITYDGLPAGVNSNHGTAVAGLIGAENNGIGGVGVAYDVSLTSFDYLETIQYSADYYMQLAAFTQSGNFDIVNNSFGLPAIYADFDPGYSVLGGTSGYNYVYLYINTMMDTLETGRGGLGTISLYAAGNDGINASGSYQTNSRATVTIGATDSNGDVTYYSNYGVSLMVTAPAASVTTDRTGTDGYSSDDYTSSFGGTSAATPVTAGVVALILDANEDLGWRDVNEILALSAQQTGSAFGSASSGYEYGTWFSNGATNWNGGGMTYHLSYGYGMVDAFAATRLAEVWDILYDDYGTSANEETLTLNYTGSSRTVSDGGSNSISITTTSHFEIDSAYVTVDLSSYDLESVSVYLVTPDGDMMMLLDQENIYNATQGNLYNYQYTFHVNGLHGMDSSGTWQLYVIDNESDGYSTTINDMTIEFYGDTYDTNDVYHFTADYGALAAEEGGRTVISDDNGGTDWLNYAMLDVSLTVRLDTGEMDLGTVGSGTITLGDFENIMGGQKRDVLIGDDYDNIIYGNDGNDTLRGNRGNDELNGGEGNDTIYGGYGFDYLYGEDGDDTIEAGKSRDRVEAGAGDDFVDGAQGKDNIFGGSGNDTLYGGTSNDRLSGGRGNDRIGGNEGDDRMYGGSGADTFVFELGDDTDTIYDFSTAEGDVLEFSSTLASSAEDALSYATVSGGNVIFDFGNGDVLIVEGISDTNELLNYIEIA
ncbi:S8 family serine peptidase [Celeribacter sp. PS-C1]|uniref:S8 family serine peptidase n=1 Tax=Celeribacter sp. PS-C1 TaxID=2820813 RepID=UPI001CA4C7E6|nr:S8 family serine peptidase [Celeribacter sp. PS-C1]MBW6416186.1 S8 family serine peptidase [Celeribacter sp. PS-C1]